MDNNKKKPVGMLIGGIITGVITVCLVVFRTLCVSELSRIKSGSGQLMKIGFKDPSSPDYMVYLENLVSKSMLTIVSFALLTVVLVALFVIHSKGISEKTEAKTVSSDGVNEMKETKANGVKDAESGKATIDDVDSANEVSAAS